MGRCLFRFVGCNLSLSQAEYTYYIACKDSYGNLQEGSNITQIDFGVFTIHPAVMRDLTVFELSYDNESVKVIKVISSLESILEKYLKRPIKLINCGGEDTITSGREQWNDGANTLAVAPGKVIVYSRNHVTNEILRKEGITVLEIPSSELSRGRGGPRCMSMPLEREDI